MSLFRKLALGITDKDLDKVGGGFVYQNNKYNFSLNFPSGWSDYIVFYRISDWGLNGKAESVVFGVQEQDSIFTITIHTQDQWTKINAEEGPKPKYINEHNGYVYGYSVAQEALSERVGKLAQNIPNIISTFKFTDETADWQTYTNSEYGFEFKYPESWNRYSIMVDEWDGYTSGAQGDEIVEQGPQISIRHPGWTTQNPRQDIPIMVFTLSQWNLLQEGNFHIGAAPVGPIELGRNSRYVFALPARYNYAFLMGYEEVIKILENNPLRAF